MPALLPPLVFGPITPHSTYVRVSGQLPSVGVMIVILADGQKIGANAPDFRGWVKLDAAPSEGQKITAVQVAGGEESLPSSWPVTVEYPPLPLQRPRFASAVSNLMSAVWVEGAVPGATLEIRSSENDVLLASVLVHESPLRVDLDLAQSLSARDRLVMVQHVDGNHSPLEVSVPLTDYSLHHKLNTLPSPVLGEPLQACATDIHFNDVMPSAETVVENEGMTTVWLNPAASFYGTEQPPLLKGKVTSRQQFSRYGIVGSERIYAVHGADKPPKPVMAAAYCPGLSRITLSSLAPGATLEVFARVIPEGSNGTVDHLIALGGVQFPSQEFDVPSSLLPPGRLVALVARQTRCSEPSDMSEVPTTGWDMSDFLWPDIVDPVYDCVHQVRVKHVEVGSMIELTLVRQGKNHTARAPFLAATENLSIALDWTLETGDELHLRQIGCAMTQKDHATVQPLPSPWPEPVIAKPLRPGMRSVPVKNCVPGARVDLYLIKAGTDEAVVVGQIEPMAETAYFPVEALAENDRVFAQQTLCDQTSRPNLRGAVVAKGKLSCLANPRHLDYGVQTPLLVQAYDVDTREEIKGLDWFMPEGLGFSPIAAAKTGGTTHVAIKSTESQHAGRVAGYRGYHDGTYLIDIRQPAPEPQPPASRLRLELADTTQFAGAFQVTRAYWSVRYGWSDEIVEKEGFAVDITPPSTGGFLYVTLRADAIAQGIINGYEFNLEWTKDTLTLASENQFSWPDDFTAHYLMVVATGIAGNNEPFIYVRADFVPDW